MNLPDLEGTEKQIDYAIDIRKACIIQFCNYLAWVSDRVASMESRGRSTATVQETIADMRRDLRIVLTVTDSEFWIKNKNFAACPSEPVVDRLKNIAIVYGWTDGFPEGIPSDDKLMEQINDL